LLSGLLLLGLLYPLAGSTETERRPFPEDYIDADTGVRFPPAIGVYRKNEVVRNFNPLIGTVVRYADMDGNCADVYIYALESGGGKITDAAVRSHFSEIRKAIENLPKKSTHVSDVQTLGEEPLRYPPHVFGRTASFRMNIAGDLRNSELAVFPFGNRIVKIRISSSPYSSGENNRFSGFTDVIARLFNSVKKEAKPVKNGKNQKKPDIFRGK